MKGRAAQFPDIESKLEQLLGQGADPDGALELLVDILIERGRNLQLGKREHCADLIRSVFPSCTNPALADAAKRLAGLDFVPPKLLKSLAERSMQAAGERSAGESGAASEAVVAIVAEARPDDLRAIAAHPGLDKTVTASLIARGDREAIRTCVRNRKAKLARATFEELVGMAKDDGEIRQALCHRPDLPEAVVPGLWERCEDTERARLLVAGFSGEAGEPDPAAPSGPDEPEDPQEDEKIKLDRQLSEIILQYADTGSLARMSRNLAERAGIDEGIAFDLICGSYEHGAVLLARAANVDEWTFLQLVCARMKLASGTSAPHRALKLFREYPRDEAKAVLAEVIAARNTDAEEAKRAMAQRRKKTDIA